MIIDQNIQQGCIDGETMNTSSRAGLAAGGNIPIPPEGGKSVFILGIAERYKHFARGYQRKKK